MKHYRTVIILILLVLLSFSLVGAQDDIDVTAEAPVVVVSPVEEVITPISDPVAITSQLFNALGLIILSFGTGVATGGLTLGLILKGLKNDIPLQNAIEKLAISLPADTLKDIQAIFVGLRDVGNLGVAVTDGKPNVLLDEQVTPS